MDVAVVVVSVVVVLEWDYLSTRLEVFLYTVVSHVVVVSGVELLEELVVVVVVLSGLRVNGTAQT